MDASYPIHVTFRGMDSSPALEAAIREHAGALSRFAARIVSVRAVLEQKHRRHRRGALFHMSLEVVIPGGDVIVSRDHEDHAHEDPYVVVRDAFDIATRRLERPVYASPRDCVTTP